MGKDLIHLPLLQFADDTLLFGKFDDQMLLKLLDSSNGVGGRKLIGKNQLSVELIYPRTSYFKPLPILAARQKIY